MTACVDPSTGPALVHRSDPKTRLFDYQTGLRFWLSLDDVRLSRIVFVENSGYPLGSLEEIARSENPLGKEVEFHTIPCNNYPAHLHYGYAELSMLDAVVRCSDLVNQTQHFVKVNGRLIFPNLPRLLNRLPSDYLFAVDGRSNIASNWTLNTYVTTQLMLFSTQFYLEHVLGQQRELMGETGHLETFFYNVLVPFQGQRGALLRWPINAPPVGEAAHWPKRYDSRRQVAVNAVRAVVRRVLPRLWL